MVYLWLPGPGSRHYHFQHLRREGHFLHFTNKVLQFSSDLQVGDLFLLTLHLDEELCLDSARCLALVLAPGAAEGVDLVDENDGRLVFPG